MARVSAADHAITQKVLQKLAHRGVRSPCKVAVNTLGGSVTLTGSVQYSHQKILAAAAATGVTGVRRVSNQILLKPTAR